MVLGGLALAILLLAIFKWQQRDPEPSFEQRSLSEWLRDLNYRTPWKHAAAQNAIRKIGAQALPFLVEALEERVSLKEKLAGMAWDAKSDRFLPGNVRRQAVCRAFAALGSEAKPAIPALINLLSRGSDTAAWSAGCLTAIGPDAIVPLCSALTNPNWVVRISACQALGGMTNTARAATSSLVSVLKDPSLPVQHAAIVALGSIRETNIFVIDALIQELHNPVSWVRSATAKALGDLTVSTKDVLEALNAATHDTDETVRSAAAAALNRLEP
ncbi:MAG: repeat-containing protein [Verrucomicrobiales bacterium]|nr:repeat-containing protein [Verrucomicrobiales bacterium]